MFQRLKQFRDRAIRRRRLRLTLIVVVAVLLLSASWRNDRPLSQVERTLVGKWGRAEVDPTFRYAARGGGVVTNPWIVQEFASDRSYRQWIVSGDDPSESYLHVEGRWRVVGGAVRFEDRKHAVREFVDNARWRLAVLTGLPLASSASGTGAAPDLPFHFVAPDHLVLEFKNQDRRDWTRLTRSVGARVRPGSVAPPDQQSSGR